MQLQAGRSKRHQEESFQLQERLRLMQDQLREKEGRLDHLSHGIAGLQKWRSRASELEAELKAVKQSQDYASAARLSFLEASLATCAGDPAVQFLATIPSGIHSHFIPGERGFEESLERMLDGADFEVVIVSPWIKRQTWNRVAGALKMFAKKGGRLRVFTRGCASDYSLGLADDLYEEISTLGGEVVIVPRLHAKIYMADRKMAIITSANLTRGGTEGNYESGLLVSDPVILREICGYVEMMADQA